VRREQRSRARRLGRFTTTFAAVVAATLVALPGEARAADDSLVSAYPVPGSALSAAPGVVVLRFAGQVSGEDSHVAVSAGGGDQVAAGDVEQPGPLELRIPVRAVGLGDFTVAYHIIFLDGGSVAGAFRFSIGTGVPPAPLSGAAKQAVTAAVAGHVHEVDGVSAVLLVADGVVALVVLFLLWARPRNGSRGGPRAWRYRDY